MHDTGEWLAALDRIEADVAARGGQPRHQRDILFGLWRLLGAAPATARRAFDSLEDDALASGGGRGLARPL